MNIAFVTTTGRDTAGIAAFVARLMDAHNRIGNKTKLIMMTKGKGTALKRTYSTFGLSKEDWVVCNTPHYAADTLNRFDVVIHENPGGFQDYKRYKNGEEPPWWYETLPLIRVPQLCLIHDPGSLKKWNPWIDRFEEVCQFFFSGRHNLIDMYAEMRGHVPVFFTDIPINAWLDYEVNLVHKDREIATTHRMFPDKRHIHLVEAMRELPEWKSLHVFHKRSSQWFYLKRMQEAIQKYQLQNVLLYDRDTTTLNSIYYRAALVYSPSKHDPGGEGGMENVPLEGVIRGAVPLMTEYWLDYPGCPPASLCYMMEVYDENGSSNIADVVSNINPQSKEYADKQAGILRWVRENKDGKVVATKMMKVLEENLR